MFSFRRYLIIYTNFSLPTPNLRLSLDFVASFLQQFEMNYLSNAVKPATIFSSSEITNGTLAKIAYNIGELYWEIFSSSLFTFLIILVTVSNEKNTSIN